jgi:arginine decarboxylase-like protein
VDLVAVIETLAANHIHLPLVLRFPDILHHRMLELQTCFSLAASKFNYKGLDMGWI